MNILVLNAGSSSVKFSLFLDSKRACGGIVEKIGHSPASFTFYKSPDDSVSNDAGVSDHESAISLILNTIVGKGVISDLSQIGAVGHRVVHGGERFQDPLVIDAESLEQLRECIPLAPLHNPHNVKGIESITKLLPDVPQVAVFDTSFHHSMPKHSFLYPLPYELYQSKRIRKFGFHGTSHSFVAKKAAEFLDRPLEELDLVTLHLGNGCSACAIKGGKSIDTSMGLTPLEGLMMGTRSGSIDPAIVLNLIRDGMSADEVDNLLNRKSGLLGVSGISNDMRDLYSTEDERAWIAIDMFVYRVIKTVGAYIAALGRCDAVILTAGIGENVSVVRERIVNGLSAFGIRYDADAGDRKETVISTSDSDVPVLCISTDEELMIAEETRRVLEA